MPFTSGNPPNPKHYELELQQYPNDALNESNERILNDDVVDDNHDVAVDLISTNRHDSVPTLSIEETEIALNSVVKRKEKDRNQLIWIFVIPAMTCKGELREVTLRELLAMVTYEVNMVDKQATIRQAEKERAKLELQEHTDRIHKSRHNVNSNSSSGDISSNNQDIISRSSDVLQREHDTPDLNHLTETHVPAITIDPSHTHDHSHVGVANMNNVNVNGDVNGSSSVSAAAMVSTGVQRRRSIATVSVAFDDLAAMNQSSTHNSNNNNNSNNNYSGSQLPPPPQTNPSDGTASLGIGKGGMRRASLIFNPIQLPVDTSILHNSSSRPSMASQQTMPLSQQQSGVHHGTGEDELVTSSAIPLRIRDLRRLDFSVNPNVELNVQVPYTCMHVVCMYVCMRARVCVHAYVCMDGCLCARVCMYCMHVCLYACMYICMHACTYVMLLMFDAA